MIHHPKAPKPRQIKLNGERHKNRYSWLSNTLWTGARVSHSSRSFSPLVWFGLVYRKWASSTADDCAANKTALITEITFEERWRRNK